MGLFDGTPLERPVLCEQCGKIVASCACPPADSTPASQILQVRIEKRKRGKWVTAISGFNCSTAQLHETLSALQSQCGAGGSINGLTVELQGDHVMRVTKLLIARGYRVRGAK